MRSFAPIAFAAVAAALPGGAPDNLKPQAAAPAGCVGDYSGSFGFSLVNVSSTEKRSLMKRDAAEFTLSGGIMKDSKGRIADVVNNQQLQFDGPPAQAGAIYDAGFAVCPNNTLVLGDFTTWKACLSGGFYNIYLKNDAPQCHEVYIEVVPMGASAPAGGAVGAKPDGQPTGGAGASQITDGQVQAPTGVSQIGDGQIQAPTNMASQITDGQIQVPTVLPAVSQIGDGQIQAPTKPAAVSQISDGQIQAPTKPAAVSQISDGQIQAPTATAAVSQISDGQVQAPTAAVSQIGDGQIQAPTNGTTAAKPSAATQQTSSGAAVRGDLFALFGAGLMAVLLL